MRVSFNYMSYRYLYDIQKSMEAVTDEGSKVTKGRSLLNPEDNPNDYANALNLQRLIDEATQFTENADNSLSWIKNTDNELQRAVDILKQAKNSYAIAGLNDSQNATSRKALASDVKSLLDSLKAVGNANYNGRYIFSGFKTDTKAFATEEKEISAVAATEDGFDIYTRNTFADMPELEEGSYKFKLEFNNDLVTVSLTDSAGNKIFLDSNGNDESASEGNMTTLEYTTKYIPGSIINTGTGVSIKLPDELPTSPSVEINFRYKPGGDIKYHGDDGHIKSTIGYDNDVDINLTGSEVFIETGRILKGTRYNTTNGIAITETTKFSAIENANSSLSEGIEVQGTDHNGIPLGVASVTSPDTVNLDMSNAEDSERELNLVYGDRNYTISVDQKSYTDMEELVFYVNRDLESQGLASEIVAKADGNKLSFHTLKSGNNVKLDITGGNYNKLGFSSTTLSSSGKDTTFLFGYDEYDLTTLENTHTNIPVNTDTTIYINNEKFTLSSPVDANDAQTQLDAQLKEKNMYFNINATVTDNAATGNLDFDFKLVNENYDNNTKLITQISNATSTIPAGEDYKYSSPRTSAFPAGDDKKVGDFLNFIEDLYDNTVKASLDNGKIVIEDLRTGESRITFAMNEQNTGIGFPKGGNPVYFSGRYTGTEDKFWRVDVTNTTGSNLQFAISDRDGNPIDTINYDVTNYHGEPIYLTQGVSITMGDYALLNTVGATDVITMDLKADSNLSFGDMNIVQDAENVDSFNSLKNLYYALEYNIDRQGVGAPSAWKDENLDSTASPYTAGDFTGNYNDLWTYNVEQTGDNSSFYIQSALQATSGELQDISAGINLDFDFTLNIGNTYQNININGNYSNWTNVTNDINTAIQNYASTLPLNSDERRLAEQVKAEIKDNKLVLNSNSGLVEVSLNPNDDITLDSLGILDSANLPPGFVSNREIVSPEENFIYDLTDKTVDERTLSFNYLGGNFQITIPAQNYQSSDDFVNIVQTEIDNQIGAGRIVAGVQNNKLYFSMTDNTIDGVHISGDYKGTLGYFAKGNEAKVKIVAGNGDTVNEVKINTANKEYFVSDGVYIGFDTGSLFATDSFTTTVGSGIEYEVDVLDKAETQVTRALTRVGTNQNKAESVINFNTTLINTNEEIKSVYLQATADDQTKAMSTYATAQHAYEAALNVTAKIMQMSLLDYLR